MPIYEYQCKACGHQMEAFQKISDQPLTECPSCHQEVLDKLVSAAGFQLKGTGWYATDYKSKPEKSKPDQQQEKQPDSKKETASTSTKETSDKGETTTSTDKNKTAGSS